MEERIEVVRRGIALIFVNRADRELFDVNVNVTVTFEAGEDQRWPRYWSIWKPGEEQTVYAFSLGGGPQRILMDGSAFLDDQRRRRVRISKSWRLPDGSRWESPGR
jgi:hypothetical protein